MTVPEQVPVTEQVANGVTVKFFVQFQYANKNDLHIYVDGVEPSISEVYFDDNAFNFYSAPQVGKVIRIERITPKERDTDYDQSDNTFRPRVVNADFDKIWYVLQEVFADIGGLSQAVQDEVISRIQGDEDLLNQLSIEISARILGDEAVTNDLKDHINQVVGAILNDPTFDGIDASKVNTDSGETQQQINDRGGATWYSKSGGYGLNERAILDNGDIVQSTVPNNIIDPNVDMVGWVYENTGQKSSDAKNTLQFSSIIKLREFEPSSHGDKVYLIGLNEGSELGFGGWYYDATDTTSVDNGWFIVKTLDNKVLKRVNLNKLINLEWAGILDQGDLAIRWQQALDYADELRIKNDQVFDCPRIEIEAGRYSMSKGITHPPYVSTLFKGATFLDVNYSRTTSPYVIRVQSKNNTSSMYDSTKAMSWNYCITSQVGKIVVRHTDSNILAANRPSGILTGNAAGSVNTYAVNCRFNNLEFRNFKDSHEILGKDSWCYTFEHCQFDGSPNDGRYGVHTSTTTNTNSGERCNYSDCFFGGFLLETPAMGLYIQNSSCDFVNGAIVTINTTATYQDMRFTNCHFEMFECIVDSKVVSFAEDISIYITGGNWLTNGLGGKKQAHDRILFKGRQNTKVRDVFVTAPIFASQNDGSKIIESGAGVNVSFSKMHFSASRPRVDSSKIISRKNDFIADAVGGLPSSISTTNFKDRNGNGNSQTSSAITVSPENGNNCLSPTANNVSAYFFIASKEKTIVQAGRRYISRPVVELSDGTLNGKFIPFIDWYDKDNVFISRSDATTFTLQEYLAGANVAWADRLTKLIPIVTPSLLAPVGAALAQHGVNCTNLDVGMSDYYLHSVILYDSLEN